MGVRGRTSGGRTSRGALGGVLGRHGSLFRAMDDHDELPERCGIGVEGRKVRKQLLSSLGVLKYIPPGPAARVEGLDCLNLKVDDAMQQPACLRIEPSMQAV